MLSCWNIWSFSYKLCLKNASACSLCSKPRRSSTVFAHKGGFAQIFTPRFALISTTALSAVNKKNWMKKSCSSSSCSVGGSKHTLISKWQQHKHEKQLVQWALRHQHLRIDPCNISKLFLHQPSLTLVLWTVFLLLLKHGFCHVSLCCHSFVL